MDFGRNFIKARHRKGVDQKDAAAYLGISAAFLSKVERNKTKPSIDLILKAAEYYGVKEGFFFQGQDDIDLDNLYSVGNVTFIEDMGSMTVQELQEKYKVKLDGKELTEQELKGIIAYLRSIRSMND